MNGTLELRGLDAVARYAIKGHADNLGPSAAWGPGSTAMLSNVVPLPLSYLGLALGEGNTTSSGANSMEQGLPMNSPKP
jgi:hypothetical protein